MFIKKVIVITGGSEGLGFEAAKFFLNAGAYVAICARSIKGLKSAAASLKGLGYSDDKLYYENLDVSEEAMVNIFVNNIFKKFHKIDVLLNNAAIYGPKGFAHTSPMDEWVQAINVNLIGSFNMIRAVVPYMQVEKYGKIIQIAGGGAASSFPMFSAYSTSKVAVVRLCENISIELAPWNIEINSIAPGALNTRLLDEVLSAGSENTGQDFYLKSLRQKESGGTPLEIPINLIKFLASSESDGISGKFISAPWDKWDIFKDHIDDLRNSDVFTLKRIIGKDRKYEWGDV